MVRIGTLRGLRAVRYGGLERDRFGDGRKGLDYCPCHSTIVRIEGIANSEGWSLRPNGRLTLLYSRSRSEVVLYTVVERVCHWLSSLSSSQRRGEFPRSRGTDHVDSARWTSVRVSRSDGGVVATHRRTFIGTPERERRCSCIGMKRGCTERIGRRRGGACAVSRYGEIAQDCTL